MSDVEKVSVRVLRGLLYNRTWLKAGTVCDMPRDLAVPYSEGGTGSVQRSSGKPYVEILGEPTGDEIVPPADSPKRRVIRNDPNDTVGDDGLPGKNTAAAGKGTTTTTTTTGPTDELLDWPGDEALKKAGITTIADLRQLIQEHGDEWPAQVKGVGKKTAADIVERLEQLDEAE